MSERVDRGGASHPLVELTMGRLRELLREPEIVFWVFFFPILMVLALGVAFRAQAPQPLSVGVAAGDGAEAVVDALRRAGGFDARLLGPEEQARAISNGEIAVLVEPARPPIYRLDPTRPDSRSARLAVDEALQRAEGREDVWSARDEPVVARGARYIDWLLPGLIGMNIMGTSMWGIGFSVVTARTRMLLKRLAATPMNRAHYLLSYLLWRLIFLFLEVAAIVGFGWLVFDITVEGSTLTLVVASLVGALSFGGVALLVASRGRTIESVSGLMNLTMTPMWLLSGVFFSSTNFPDVMQPFVQALPLTALNDALRAVMLDGAGLAATAGELGILAAWGVVSFAAALKLFRWS